MKFVRTVCGDIPSEQVGFAHCHEHAFILPGRSAEVNPALLLDDFDKTVAELKEFRAGGGRTIVDAQPIGQERSPLLQRRASREAGVHVVATTGFHRACYYQPGHFRFHEPVERLAERMAGEITSGMAVYAGSSEAETTDVRAGLLKLATEYHVIGRDARRVAEAIAIAHRQTGAPVITHTERGTCGLEQVRLMEDLGVPPSALLISHLDRNPDIYLHTDVAASGAYLVYDGISRAKYFPDSTIVALIVEMIAAGYGDRLLLGMDMGPRTMWRSYGGGPGMAYLAGVFLPKLRRAGLGEEDIHALTTANPAAALALRA